MADRKSTVPPPSRVEGRNVKLDSYIEGSVKRFGELVRILRKARNLTQQDIEARGQIASGLLSRVENGNRALHLETALRVAAALGMQPGQLFALLDGPQPIATFGAAGDSTLIIAGGSTPKSVDDLSRELESRSASKRNHSRRLGRK